MIDSVEFDLQAFEASQAEARKAYEKLGEDSSRKELIEAANYGLISALSRHFAMREKEMPKSTGFPWFGQHYPKRYFWSGTRGTSVSERIRVTLSSPARLVSQVSINSPALAHKLASSPPDIKPKGGRRYLAIPANVVIRPILGPLCNQSPKELLKNLWVPALNRSCSRIEANILSSLRNP